MSVEDELDKLKKLHDAGTITDEQYERAKAKLLAEEPVPAEEALDKKAEDELREDRDERRPRRRDRDDRLSPAEEEKQTRQWALFLHLSMLAGHVVPGGGIVAPVLIWQLKKDDLPGLDRHGKNAANWIISSIIYVLICIPLFFVVVGIPLLIVLGVLSVVFPIIAAVKANDGEVWRYPMTITFFK